jgi:hypothetical protein
VARLRQGKLRLHGWVYHIGQGIVTAYDPGRNSFFPIRASKSPGTKLHEANLKTAKKRTRA